MPVGQTSISWGAIPQIAQYNIHRGCRTQGTLESTTRSASAAVCRHSEEPIRLNRGSSRSSIALCRASAVPPIQEVSIDQGVLSFPRIVRLHGATTGKDMWSARRGRPVRLPPPPPLDPASHRSAAGSLRRAAAVKRRLLRPSKTSPSGPEEPATPSFCCPHRALLRGGGLCYPALHGRSARSRVLVGPAMALAER